MRSSPLVHRVQASLFPVNAYLVETTDGVIAVDATLGVSDGRAIRARVGALGKPLLAVLLTHSHPDHYGGIAPLLGGDVVPVIAVGGVDDVVRRDDAVKEAILRPMFGAEWPTSRTFPTRRVSDGERVEFGDVGFRVLDLGPGESPHDSVWVLDGDGPTQAFVGDLVYSHMHGYLADGFYTEWLGNITRARRELPPDATFLMGHGEPGTAAPLLAWQERYIETFLSAVREGPDEPAALAYFVSRELHALLPTEDLFFLAQLSVEPLRARLRASTAMKDAMSDAKREA